MGACMSAQPNRSVALVVWDIENVRPPLAQQPHDQQLAPGALARLLVGRFATDAGYAEVRIVCGATLASLRAMEGQIPGLVDGLSREVALTLGSHTRPKCAADYVLRRELSQFMHEHAPGVRAGTTAARVVLVTGDQDFLEPAQRALQLGFDVQLVHYGQNSAAVLRALPYASPPVEWAALCRSQSLSPSQLVFPYGDARQAGRRKGSGGSASSSACSSDCDRGGSEAEDDAALAPTAVSSLAPPTYKPAGELAPHLTHLFMPHGPRSELAWVLQR